MRSPEYLSALARRCTWCGKGAMVPCVTGSGAYARRAHRVRVYPVRVVLA